RSKKIIAQKYGVKLIVVLWDGLSGEDAFESDWIAKHLSEKGIPLLRVSIELPQLKESKYYIPKDGHPNADGYGLVAEALVKFLPAYLGRPSEASDTGGLISSHESCPLSDLMRSDQSAALSNGGGFQQKHPRANCR